MKIFLFFCAFVALPVMAQQQLYPTIGQLPPLSEKDRQEFERLQASGENEVMGDFYTIQGEGCSWYCAGGPDSMAVSSALPDQGKNSYGGWNVHDDSYATAWVEGAEGNGIGESVRFFFSERSPRVTSFTIYNGYVKSEQAWKNNGRVKTLELLFNDKVIAEVHLKDTRAAQTFTIKPLWPRYNFSEADENKPDKHNTLTFRIKDVYPGAKYTDVALTDIIFDGLDVHCFVAGTLITMADRSQKPIEQLKVDDAILVYDPVSGQLGTDHIRQLARQRHGNLIDLCLSNGTQIRCTADHPFLSENGWVSFDPSKTQADYGYAVVEQLCEGSLLRTASGERVTVENIGVQPQAEMTYTIVATTSSSTFIANGLVVGTEPTVYEMAKSAR